MFTVDDLKAREKICPFTIRGSPGQSVHSLLVAFSSTLSIGLQLILAQCIVVASKRLDALISAYLS